MRSFRFLAITFAASLAAGCGGSGNEQAASEQAEAAADGASAAADDWAPLDIAALKQQATRVVLVPSPTETQAALGKAGIDATLSDLVQDRTYSDKSDADHVAVRTGVVMADVLLTLKTSEKAKLTERLKAIESGMGTLGVSGELQGTLAELVAQVENDQVDPERNDLLRDLEDVAGSKIPAAEFDSDTYLPLLQAGSWLEGANLIARAMQAEGKFEQANQLLKQPEVVEYFLRYVEDEGQERAADHILVTLKDTLNVLLTTAQKESLSSEDVKTIQEATDSVLALL
jgi:hypothetical protein